MIFKKHWLFGVFLIVIASLLGYKLLTTPQPLFDWDESLYVQNGIEMIENRVFLVPLWQGKVWLDKPPLSPLLFGIAAKLTPLPVEISTRFFTLSLSLIALTLIYALYYKVTKNSYIATLTAVITAFMPIFTQRMQVVSLDPTLLIGWLGFFLFAQNPIISTLFLFLSIQSKSLLGFYPLVLYGGFQIYLLVTKQIKMKRLGQILIVLFCQGLFLSLWYLLALGIYREAFWEQHIIESHFRRVSASLESHFGQRTFYFDLLLTELSWIRWLSLAGFLGSLYLFLRKKIPAQTFFLMNAFFPWFIFLNLTKTKIAWYLYPILPQFAFYAAYCLTFIKNKWLQGLLAVGLLAVISYQGIVSRQLLTLFYSAEDPHIKIAKEARQNCANLAVLVPDYTRETYATLHQMGLTITTTNWWGEHPSMVFYFKKPLKFFYSVNAFKRNLPRYQCAVVNIGDEVTLAKSNLTIQRAFGKMRLYRK